MMMMMLMKMLSQRKRLLIPSQNASLRFHKVFVDDDADEDASLPTETAFFSSHRSSQKQKEKKHTTHFSLSLYFYFFWFCRILSSSLSLNSSYLAA
jgi:hypothetical protein